MKTLQAAARWLSLRALLLSPLLLGMGCARWAARRPAPPAAQVPTSVSIPVPTPSAPSGLLYRVGLKSDLSEFLYGLAGSEWAIVAAGRAEILRSPLAFRPGEAGFQVQAGAYSQQEPARQQADRLAERFQTGSSVAFSADRGVYRVLLGSFATRPEAEEFASSLRESGYDAIVAVGAVRPSASPATITVAGQDSKASELPSPVEIFPASPGSPVFVDGRPYRGSLQVLVNPRGTLTLVNRVDLEEYLYGVVPAEMGPPRYDELEALKAQAVAARTYALANRGQFESEGYDLCPTAKCQVYAGLAREEPLTRAAVDATRGMVLAFQGQFVNALFASTCGGRTENIENVFGETPVPYLVSVECGELEKTEIPGARVRGDMRPRTGMEFRGFVLKQHAPRRKATRASWLETAQKWAGLARKAAPPPTLAPAAVYPRLLAAFGLAEASAVHLLPSDESYYSDPPPASGRLTGRARDAYDFFVRFRLGAGESLPPPDRNLTEEEYGGLLFSVALRLLGVAEGSGKFLSREGGNLWVKTPQGRQILPVDPELPLARRIGNFYFSSASLMLRAGDRLRWWRNGSKMLALSVEMEAVGPSYERESTWTEWVRRASGKELARRMAARVEGTEVREISVTRRSDTGRAIEIQVRTDAAEVTLQRFDLRQALELPEMLFTISQARNLEGEVEFLFLGRGWGHGVGLCQNGAYGMALAGAGYDAILRHYYTGIDIVPASSITVAASR